MSITAVVGANWGDEGKGKITDLLAQDSDFVVRFQGGNNAGHTIINDYGKFQLHILPSGVFNPKTINVLATGVAINLEAFLYEYKALIERGVPKPNIAISSRAQVVLPQHIVFDKEEEKRLGDKQFGSTQSGMAPFYADKFLKIGIQVDDIFNYDILLSKIRNNLEIKNILARELYKITEFDVQNITNYIYGLGKEIKPFVKDTRKLLIYNLDKKILMEGQLGALKDPDHGIYPMTTSSNTLASYSTVSCGLPANRLSKVVTVVKAYSSCVGEGPFVTELDELESNELRIRGGDNGEFGASTGRPRRVGWFDAVATRYGCEIQGTTDVVLSLLDVLSYLDEIPICIAYDIDGERSVEFPTFNKLQSAKPIYTTLKGWRVDISSIKKFDNLPEEAKTYVKTIESLIGFKIKYISVGSKRDQVIFL